MSEEHTVPEQWEPQTEALSRADTRVISRGSVKSAELEPRLVLARRTLGAFVIDNQHAPLKFEHAFEIAGSDRLKTGEIQICSLVDDESGGIRAFTVALEYRGRESISQLCESQPAYRKLRHVLFENGLVFRSATGATVSKVTIEPKVPAALTVSADLRSGCVTITLRNILLLGTMEYELTGERMDRAFIESLAGLLSGRSAVFYTLAENTSPPGR